jgi:hypothetical protein
MLGAFVTVNQEEDRIWLDQSVVRKQESHRIRRGCTQRVGRERNVSGYAIESPVAKDRSPSQPPSARGDLLRQSTGQRICL